MEANVVQELDVLKGMLNNWKRGFIGWASADGDNEYVLLEFTEDIQQHLYPYVTRLRQTKHLSDPEAREFMDYCFNQVKDLRDQLSRTEIGENQKEA